MEGREGREGEGREKGKGRECLTAFKDPPPLLQAGFRGEVWVERVEGKMEEGGKGEERKEKLSPNVNYGSMPCQYNNKQQ